jgi:putative ABC transport system ATP-binding protein
MDLLSELNEAGTTIVMVTHSPADAEYSARTIHLFDGKVVSENFIEQEYAAHPGH